MCLDDVDRVTLRFRHEETKTELGWAVATILDPATPGADGEPIGDGWIHSPLFPELTAAAGLVAVEVDIEAHGLSRSVPATPRSRYFYISVRRNFAMADAIVNPNPGQLVGSTTADTPEPLWLPDGTTGTVTADHQLVMAGSGVTVNVDPDVTEFRIAEWSTETPWIVGNTPTVVLAGTALEALGPTKLAQANGDLVTIARPDAGSTWYVVGPDVTAGGALEIGHGSALPADGTVFQVFEIENSTAVPPLPNGLYRYDDTAGVWIQE